MTFIESNMMREILCTDSISIEKKIKTLQEQIDFHKDALVKLGNAMDVLQKLKVKRICMGTRRD